MRSEYDARAHDERVGAVRAQAERCGVTGYSDWVRDHEVLRKADRLFRWWDRRCGNMGLRVPHAVLWECAVTTAYLEARGAIEDEHGFLNER
jgi:hypothetical protein